ncbi:MAG TPA: hypothetical protein VKY89_00030 [Thermoanaerobaculia bacterium]|nr:hypothetical protein [Thermoanaerobaculia bacterium]
MEHKDWHHWGLFRALLDAARWYRSRDPQEAVDVAQLALDVVELLDQKKVGGEAAAKDMQAAAFALLAECRRRASDLDGARAAIAEAWRWNEEGEGDPLDKAEIYYADAAYAATVGEVETAESILEKALALYRAMGDAHLEGRTLIQMAKTVGYENPEKAVGHIERALDLISPVREPRRQLCAQHAHAEFLTAAGRPQDALGVLDRVRPLYRDFPDEWAQLRFHWLQGRVAHALRQFREAADILRQVREEFCARDEHRDFLMISIDLAEAHVAAREMATALSFLEETTPILAGSTLHRNAMAAWLLFQKTLEECRDLKPAALAPLLKTCAGTTAAPGTCRRPSSRSRSRRTSPRPRRATARRLAGCAGRSGGRHLAPRQTECRGRAGGQALPRRLPLPRVRPRCSRQASQAPAAGRSRGRLGSRAGSAARARHGPSPDS